MKSVAGYPGTGITEVTDVRALGLTVNRDKLGGQEVQGHAMDVGSARTAGGATGERARGSHGVDERG